MSERFFEDPIPKAKQHGGRAKQVLQRSLEIEAQNISTVDQRKL
jgi:hypothetical protein